jgi:hypothetical protein
MNILKKLIAVSFLLQLACLNELFSQSLTGELYSENKLLKLNLVNTFELTETDYLLSSILDIEYVNDDSLLIITNTEDAVILFTAHGSVQKRISKFGRGPFEFVSPTLSRVINNSFFIWDSSQLKLSVFDKNGNGLREYSGFRWAINDFLVSGDYIYVINRGNSTGKILEKYPLAGLKRYPLFEAIDKTEEHLFLSSIQPSVGMAQNDEQILFISPSSLTLYALDTSSNEVESINLEDDDFHIPSIRSASRIWSGAEDPSAYLRESSIVTNLIQADGYTIIIAKMGQETFSRTFSIYTAEERFFKIFVLDTSLALIDTLKYNLSDNGVLFDGKWFSSGDKLGYVSRQNISEQPNTDNSIKPYTVHIFDILTVTKN